jgi:uncharacterized HAD superfamily protein
MRIGFDLDGVFANFIPAYQRLFVEESGGVDLFKPGDNIDPPVWDWPEMRGYSKDITRKVWKRITQDPTFWLNLEETAEMKTLRLLLPTLQRDHEVYFITSRPHGADTKWQTEAWLYAHLVEEGREPVLTPTVLIVGSRVKGAACRMLGLDIYIDDNLDNVNDCVAESPKTRTYLLDRNYNQTGLVNEKSWGWIRVPSVGIMFDREAENL